MSTGYRRYEMLLPLRYNDGAAVPPEAVADTLLELRRQFGAVSCESQTIQGAWQHEGQVFRDDLIRLFVDVPDVIEHREFFIGFKERHRVDLNPPFIRTRPKALRQRFLVDPYQPRR